MPRVRTWLGAARKRAAYAITAPGGGPSAGPAGDGGPSVFAPGEAPPVVAEGGQAPHQAVTELPGVGKAARCQLSAATGAHPARRWVWHHVLPQACGGKTTAANLAELCDSCHYAVHDLMWLMANGTPAPPGPHTRGQLALAQAGYQEALAAGTASRMPKEA